ncbi:hypothetical protein [Chitinophaga ginsengisoli]|uniref:IPT/TIG domain-containing protein n=1 Tax=Chitinophaga ginsengisoli TaxID=363837 RepID=A0A2P8GQ56_9BACT|nr:hypothetical protein [Chitinophaga ginsengisoli]PSL36099.1 hypothetical protein CLV42_101868 [Chitinophaga ginsengisoli]
MKKARIALATIALMAVVGGAFAFKAMRTGLAFYTTTNSYSTFGTLYSAAAPFVGPHLVSFITPNGATNADAVSVTGTTVGGPITLTQVGGTATITIPRWTGPTYATRTTLAN